MSKSKKLMLLVAMLAMVGAYAVQAFAQQPNNYFLITEAFGGTLPEPDPVECEDTTDPIDLSTCSEIESIPEGLICDIPVRFFAPRPDPGPAPETALPVLGFQCRVPTPEPTPTPPAPESPPAPEQAAACPPPTLAIETEDLESGDASQSTSVVNEADNSNQTAAIPNVSNTGNLQNVQGVLQSCSEADDIEFSGSSIDNSPVLESESVQTAQQAAAS